MWKSQKLSTVSIRETYHILHDALINFIIADIVTVVHAYISTDILLMLGGPSKTIVPTFIMPAALTAIPFTLKPMLGTSILLHGTVLPYSDFEVYDNQLVHFDRTRSEPLLEFDFSEGSWSEARGTRSEGSAESSRLLATTTSRYIRTKLDALNEITSSFASYLDISFSASSAWLLIMSGLTSEWITWKTKIPLLYNARTSETFMVYVNTQLRDGEPLEQVGRRILIGNRHTWTITAAGKSNYIWYSVLSSSGNLQIKRQELSEIKQPVYTSYKLPGTEDHEKCYIYSNGDSAIFFIATDCQRSHCIVFRYDAIKNSIVPIPTPFVELNNYDKVQPMRWLQQALVTEAGVLFLQLSHYHHNKKSYTVQFWDGIQWKSVSLPPECDKGDHTLLGPFIISSALADSQLHN